MMKESHVDYIYICKVVIYSHGDVKCYKKIFIPNNIGKIIVYMARWIILKQFEIMSTVCWANTKPIWAMFRNDW